MNNKSATTELFYISTIDNRLVAINDPVVDPMDFEGGSNSLDQVKLMESSGSLDLVFNNDDVLHASNNGGDLLANYPTYIPMSRTNAGEWSNFL